MEVERKLAADTIMSDERRQRRLIALGKEEGVFLRLKKIRTGLTDPRTVKVTRRMRLMKFAPCGRLTSGACVMKTLKEMLKKDQVRSLCPVFTLYAVRYDDLVFHSTFLRCQLPHVRSAISLPNPILPGSRNCTTHSRTLRTHTPSWSSLPEAT